MSELEVPFKPHLVNGLKVPAFVEQEDVDRLKHLKLFSNDVWIATYPKSGTIWTSQIARLIRNRGVQDDVVLPAAVLWPEGKKVFEIEGRMDIADIKPEDLSQPRLLRSHFPYSLFPCGPPNTTPCKYIYVLRNPKDVAVSLYSFTKHYSDSQDLEWDTFWQMYINGDTIYGDYFDHLLSWWPHRNDKNVLFLRYEDMKKNVLESISKIADFMEIDLPHAIIAKVADLVSFEKMKVDKTANMSWAPHFVHNGESLFMRKGVVGDWKNFLSDEQSAEIDTKCARKLEGFNVDFEFGD